ncbi:hypothetical protein OC709_01735 ['Planchonia careya' phytoplasma]|nr:hypothetical protein ['Planchonia careya' phytoplasma]MDO8030231.1 hypothetical protein ['Planchonia careya' phytoplasma]
MRLEQYYWVENCFGNQNIVLLPTKEMNEIITPDLIQKGYNEDKTFKFCKINRLY